MNSPGFAAIRDLLVTERDAAYAEAQALDPGSWPSESDPAVPPQVLQEAYALNDRITALHRRAYRAKSALEALCAHPLAERRPLNRPEMQAKWPRGQRCEACGMTEVEPRELRSHPDA